MERNVITNEITKSTNKLLKKYSEVEINPETKRLRGSFKITRYRQYEFHNEIEIEFKGELLAKYNSLDEKKWFNSKICSEKSFSKTRINKFIKYCLYDELKRQCSYFGFKLTSPAYIKKVKWI
jgi:hypothetical protein